MTGFPNHEGSTGVPILLLSHFTVLQNCIIANTLCEELNRWNGLSESVVKKQTSQLTLFVMVDCT